MRFGNHAAFAVSSIRLLGITILNSLCLVEPGDDIGVATVRTGRGFDIHVLAGFKTRHHEERVPTVRALVRHFHEDCVALSHAQTIPVRLGSSGVGHAEFAVRVKV